MLCFGCLCYGALELRRELLSAEARTVYLNLGAHITPLLPPEDDPTTISIAYEPLAHAQILPRPRLYVVPAAVAAEGGAAIMSNMGESSSLSAPALEGRAIAKRAIFRNYTAKEQRIVPVVAMSAVLRGIPPDMTVLFLKTDMQGHDLSALRAAGSLLATRVHYIMSECYLRGTYVYLGVQNDYCRDFLPTMLALGYEPLALAPGHKYGRPPRHIFADAQAARAYCAASENAVIAKAGLDEANSYWRLKGTTLPPPASSEWPSVLRATTG